MKLLMIENSILKNVYNDLQLRYTNLKKEFKKIETLQFKGENDLNWARNILDF